ncbi:MAG: HAMP domain-containing sensor histidine kinase [Dysgonamonadaceae bacterium]|nr:HAMP domain-containing sensor histidine kinase [Dysgonamonadaceae bacterium]
MSRQRKDLSIAYLSRTITRRFFITLFLFTVILLLVFVLSAMFFSGFTWYGNELLYPILSLIQEFAIPFLLMCWFIGFYIIFRIHWRKGFSYINTIVDASNQLVAANEELIQLPVELNFVEDRMNQIKQDAIRNALRAQEAEQRKNDLIVYLAHDLKTPLTSVIGYLTLLRDERQISEELQSRYLSVALDKAERLEDLINEFFEITRFNLSHISLEVSQVNLTRMLEQIIFEFQPILAEKSLEIYLECPEYLEIKLDGNLMERVFDNLIRNAVHYSFKNTIIDIVVKDEPYQVILYFRNRGNTIPKDKLNRIFEQFFRLDPSRASQTGGSGLGLAIARQLVEAHQGTIQAHSENENIEFQLTLPKQF